MRASGIFKKDKDHPKDKSMSIAYARIMWTSKRFRHQVFSTDETKDGDFIVFIQNAERTKNLIQCRAAGGNIIDNQDVLFFQ